MRQHVISIIVLLFAIPAFSQTTSSNDKRLYPELSLRLNGGVNSMTSSISGEGMKASLPNTIGHLYGGELYYNKAESNLSAFVKYDHRSARHMDVANTTPDDFTQTHTRTEVGIMGHQKNITLDRSICRMGLGLFYEQRTAQRVGPAIAANSILSGPLISFGFTDFLGANFLHEGDLSISFPNYFKESNTITGQYHYGVSSVVSYKVIFPYTKDLDLGLGVTFKYDHVVFTGTSSGASSRGVTDAVEKFMNIGVPFELRFRF